jgi:hypothetical protein
MQGRDSPDFVQESIVTVSVRNRIRIDSLPQIMEPGRLFDKNRSSLLAPRKDKPKNKNGPSRMFVTGRFLLRSIAEAKIILAATYVPTQLPVQYHRLSGA